MKWLLAPLAFFTLCSTTSSALAQQDRLRGGFYSCQPTSDGITYNINTPAKFILGLSSRQKWYTADDPLGRKLKLEESNGDFSYTLGLIEWKGGPLAPYGMSRAWTDEESGWSYIQLMPPIINPQGFELLICVLAHEK